MGRISELTAMVSQATTDIFAFAQSGVRTFRETRQQLSDWVVKTGLSFIQNSVSAVAEALQSRLRWEVRVTDFLSDANRAILRAGTSVVDITTATQAAVDQLVAGGGGKLILPTGFCGFSAAVTITKGLVVEGGGIGAGSGSGNSGGTVIRSTVTTGDVFTVSSAQGVVFRDFTIDAPSVTKAANTAGIRIQGEGGSGNVNRRSRVENVRIANMYDGIVWDTAADCIVRGCHIQDYLNIGIYSKQTGGVDDGQNTIDGGTVIWDLNVGNSQACIRYDKGGDIRIIGNKLLGSDYGIRVNLDDGETGTMLVTGNSFEEQKVNDIRIAQATINKNFGNLVIVGNQFSIVAPATPQNNIAVVAGTAGGGATSWVKNIDITGNVINNAHNASFAAISVADGEGIVVAANTICGGGQANPTGIDVASTVTAARVQANKIFDMPGGSYSTATYKWIPASGSLLLSSGAATVAAGATVYLGPADANATEGLMLFYLPFKARIRNLHTHANTAPVGAETFIYTLRVNGSDTALTCTVTGGNTDGQDRTNAVAVPTPAGPNTAARLSLKLVTSGGAAAAVHTVGFEIVEDDG